MPHNQVTIGDWACGDGFDRVTDDDGTVWTLTELTGWFDSPDPRGEPTPRPGADGDYDGEPTLSARTVTVAGSINAQSGPLLQAARDRVTALLAGSQRYGTLVVDEVDRGLSRQAVVRLGGQTLTQQSTARDGTFSLSLYAPDPRRYSSVLHTASTARFTPGGGRSYDLVFDRSYGGSGSSGVVSVSNAGARSTWPVLRFAGPLPNPYARLVGGSTVAASLTLAAGQELVVDCGLRSVLLGTASRRQFLSQDGFFALPPGDSQVYFSADSGTGSLTVQWRDAW